MYHRAFLSVGAVLIAACSTPSEPEPATPSAETASASIVAASAVAPAAATSPLATRLEPAPPHVAIEDALLRVLPALEDQSIARELRPMLQEAQRLLGRKVSEARVLDRLGTRLNEIAASQQDPDLAAVRLALEASR